jgi:hypothetical protein
VSKQPRQDSEAADAAKPEEELAEFDYMDPLKRDPEEEDALPGLDPIIPPVPPEE